MIRQRVDIVIYAGLAIITVVLGLTTHLHGFGLQAAARDILGDALWAAMIYWLIALIAPHVSVVARASVAVAVCVAVELSQLMQHPALMAVRSSTLGHLVIGSDFDARDLLAYGAGIAGAVVLERAILRRQNA